jgi:hypothetical protein
MFGGFQWARVVSPFKLLTEDDPVHAWRERLLDAFDGMARKSPGYPLQCRCGIDRALNGSARFGNQKINKKYTRVARLLPEFCGHSGQRISSSR